MSVELGHFPYHAAVLEYFRSHERVRWESFHEATVASERESRLQLQLRKSARRLELIDALPWLHEAVTTGIGAELGSPVASYLATSAPELAVRVVPLLDQPRLVFEGPVLESLSQDEVRALVAGELTRFQFWQQEAGDYLSVSQLLAELQLQEEVPRSHELTAQRFELCTNLLADQGALDSCDNAETVVAALVKCRPLPDGVGKSLDAASLLEQAQTLRETVDPQTTSSAQRNLLLRIATLQSSARDRRPDVKEVEKQVLAFQSLDELDLLQQLKVMTLTRELICCLLEPAWIQTPAVISYARSYFADLQVEELVSGNESELEQLGSEVRQFPQALKDYFCFMLLDFSAADRDLNEAPLAMATEWTDRFEITERFRELAQRELRLRKTQFAKILQEREQILAAVERSDE